MSPVTRPPAGPPAAAEPPWPPPPPPVRRRRRADRGATVPEYVGILALIAALCASLLVLGLPGRTSGAVCRALQKIHLADGCTDAGRPGGAAQDPDEPRTGCTKGVESKYLEETVTIPTPWKVGARTNSRNTLQLIQKVGPDGKITWEVTDFTWGEGGAGLDVAAGPVKFGIWGGGQFTNGNVYSFGNVDEARKFFDDLVDHRIGNTAKFVVRTNPVTGGLSWLVGKIPFVGEKYEEWIGASEPDKDPSADYHEGGPTGGFKGDISIGKLKGSVKARGWLIDGTRTDHKTGEKTTYYSRKGEGEAGVVVDLGDIWKVLPKGVRERAASGASDALELAMGEIEKRISGRDIQLLPEEKEKIKKQIRLNPSVGFNFKQRAVTTWSYTEDKDGRPIRMTKSRTSQNVIYFRIDGKTSGAWGGDKGEMTEGKQWILSSTRTVTDKTLDLTDPADRQALEQYGSRNDNDVLDYFTRYFDDLDKYFDAGGGRMSRLVYDVDGDTGKFDLKADGAKKFSGLFESSREHEKSALTGAEYFKPGQGWVTWKRCLG